MKTVERVDDYGDDYGLQKKRILLVPRVVAVVVHRKDGKNAGKTFDHFGAETLGNMTFTSRIGKDGLCNYAREDNKTLQMNPAAHGAATTRLCTIQRVCIILRYR